MRDIIILQQGMEEARRITRAATVRIAGESIAARSRRIIDANLLANQVLLRARAEATLSLVASNVVTASLRRSSK